MLVDTMLVDKLESNWQPPPNLPYPDFRESPLRPDNPSLQTVIV